MLSFHVNPCVIFTQAAFCGLLAILAAPLTAQPDARQIPENHVIVNYHRFDGDYEQATLWTWDAREQRTPEDQEIEAAGKTNYGVYFIIDRSEYGDDDSQAERIGFIPRLRYDWNEKDGNDRFWNPSLGQEIWLIGNDPSIYTERPDVSPQIALAGIDGPREIFVKLSSPIDETKIAADRFQVTGPGGAQIPVEQAHAAIVEDGKARTIDLLVSRPLDPKEDYTVAMEGYRSAAAVPRGILDDPELFLPDVPMGAIYTPEETTFRLFSPLAREAAVVLFDERTGGAGRTEYAMEKQDQGYWEHAVNGDLEGKFYRLKVTTDTYGTREINDPYATNTTGHDGHARITDIRAQDPEGFRPVDRPEYGDSPADAVIWEIHIRDFTISDFSGVPEDLKGKYEGFHQEGAVLPGNASIQTGIDHLKDLGVTHVQLLPTQDFDNRESDPVYSWGYMTAFFNSPEGWFASDYRDESRIREFKELVQALHEAGIGVILDVVYNHTGTQNTFESAAPGYYLRQRDDGSFYNGSGTGNEFRSEAPMGRRFILESLKFWVEEYGVDGFRFDLMGLIDLETMKQIRAELTAISPDILIYGEPWTAPTETGLDQVTLKHVISGTGIGAFNDNFRNAIKGPPDGEETGYVQDGSNRRGVKLGIAGSIDDWAADPVESINYASAHDDLTLWDKLLHSARGLSEENYARMQMLSTGILAVSQGVLFYHAGTELCRTKDGVSNSYNAGDEINQLEWERLEQFPQVHAYMRGMIALRRAHPVFRLATAEEVRSRIEFHETGRPIPSSIVFSLKAEGLDGEEWSRCAVFINPAATTQEFQIPHDGPASVYALGEQAGLEPLAQAEDILEVPGRSLALIAWD